MNVKKAVAYLRVSTEKQGRSGLGLESQRASVRDFLAIGSWPLVAEFVEVESGRKNDRPQLEKALAECRVHQAALVVAKLDRLSRDAHFLLGLAKSRVEFIAVDMPSANTLTVGILALVAQEEARLISIRTKDALKAAKARGVKLGRPNLTPEGRSLGARRSAAIRSEHAQQRVNDLTPRVVALREQGLKSLAEIADSLNASDVRTPRGGQWSRAQVKRLIDQIDG
jgi:DNA invertase Pin-like site-specific DNA recombinase